MTAATVPTPTPAAAEAIDGQSLPPALELRGLGVIRDGRQTLRDVHLHLDAGGCLALVGPNGGGKTTLLRAALGLLPANQVIGHIQLAGHLPAEAKRLGNVVGYVPQRPNVPGALPMTGRQVVALAAPTTPRHERSFATDLLAQLHGSDALHDVPVTSMSGGQLQQVFLARALANQPKLLLLDEPTVGLDKAAVDRLVNVLTRARREIGCGVLIATHDHLVALRLTNDLAYLDTTIRYRGPANEVPAQLDARLCHHE